MTPGKGSKYREFYDLSGRITCMQIMSPQPKGGGHIDFGADPVGVASFPHVIF